jgi:hypothetical protein
MHHAGERYEPPGNDASLRITQHHVPATQQLERITATQEEAHALLYDKCKTIDQICHLLGPARATCEGYIQSSLEAGYAYKWEVFGIDDRTLNAVRQTVDKLRRKSSKAAEAAGEDSFSDDAEDKENSSAASNKRRKLDSGVPSKVKSTRDDTWWPKAKDVRKVMANSKATADIVYGHIKWSLIHLQQLQRRGG